MIDTQSVRAAVNVHATTTGKDAAKKVPGRKRGLAVDVLGLVIAVTVLAASAHDNAFVEIVERNSTDTGVGFVPQAKRWIVEQTLGILMLFRRLVRNYESGPKSSESGVAGP